MVENLSRNAMAAADIREGGVPRFILDLARTAMRSWQTSKSNGATAMGKLKRRSCSFRPVGIRSIWMSREPSQRREPFQEAPDENAAFQCNAAFLSKQKSEIAALCPVVFHSPHDGVEFGRTRLFGIRAIVGDTDCGGGNSDRGFNVAGLD